jgi:preprotein translocase subunit YajC
MLLAESGATAQTVQNSSSGFMPLIIAILLMMLGVMYFTNKKQKADLKEIKEILTTGKINTDNKQVS